MNVKKSNVISKWNKALPMMAVPFNTFQDTTPLFYTQQGNALFVKVDGKQYVFEINLPESLEKHDNN